MHVAVGPTANGDLGMDKRCEGLAKLFRLPNLHPQPDYSHFEPIIILPLSFRLTVLWVWVWVYQKQIR